MNKESTNQNVFGMIGLGTMGSNLLQNIADQGFDCAGYDNDSEKVDNLNNLNRDNIHGFSDISDFAKSLKSPKTVMMLVPAGKIVDAVIEELLQVLGKGDIIIDGGNSHFNDTERRYKDLEKKGFRFIGMGVSGGEEGARKGPSMMPGGDKKAYEAVEPVLKKIAAQVNGEPTVAYMGLRSAGHFVKMVHNGIEYAIMQSISEAYEICKKGLKMKDDEIHQVFEKWNEGRLQSYLIEITRDIFTYKTKGTEHLLLNDIKDEAKAKGTGKWTSQAAMDLSLPVPNIDIAVSMRDLSKYKKLRLNASELYADSKPMKYEDAVADYANQLEKALFFALVSAYAQGMHLLSRANEEYDYKLNLDLIAQIWRGGCIIRSEFLNDIYSAYNRNSDLKHLFLDGGIHSALAESLPGIRKVVSDAVIHGIAVPSFSAAISYFDNFRNAEMPANLIQAQRDYFGSHTYELKGKQGTFHTEWQEAE
ncbi:MAG: NADP-dependent phosphogluconate dehydrogenase [Lentimicrobium sp.]|jgi:6-phosphogluconate dehydrogenase|nr:NADP-dependent phosphogluconate dehydrogenase [Lentimicrobium sp.]